MADIYFWRQLFVLTTGLFSALTIGFMLAFPSVLNPAITSLNSTDIRTTKDHASWITAFNGIGGLVGCFIMPPILHVLGRKICHYCLNFCFLIGWIIFCFAQNVTGLYIARFIQGISTGGIYINNFIISEYVHPSRRGYFITLKKVFTAVGILLCHVLGMFWTWRQITILAGVFALFAMVMTYFWPESPSHLALKGKFTECERSFIWMNGDSKESRKNLKSLLEAQRENMVTVKTENNSVLDLLKKFLQKDFQRAFVISFMLTLSIDVCGRHYYTAYIIQIMTELTNNKTSALYFTFIADSLSLLAVCMSAIIVTLAKRRTILFYSGTTSALLMLLISVLIYLKTVYTFTTYGLWITALIIILQSFSANIGLIPVAFTIMGEIFPLEHKGFGSFASCFVFTSLYAIILKLTPVLIEHTGLYGLYSIFGVVLALCLIILYKTVPETKDKTLQDIEDELKGKTHLRKGEIDTLICC